MVDCLRNSSQEGSLSKSRFPTLNICETEPGLPHWLISNISSTPTIFKRSQQKTQVLYLHFLAKLLKSLYKDDFLSLLAFRVRYLPKDTRHQGLDQLIKYYRSLELEMFPKDFGGASGPSERSPEVFPPKNGCEQLSIKVKKNKRTVSWLNHFLSKHFLVKHHIWPSWGFFPLKRSWCINKKSSWDHIQRPFMSVVFFFAKETTVWCIHFFQSISVKAS